MQTDLTLYYLVKLHVAVCKNQVLVFNARILYMLINFEIVSVGFLKTVQSQKNSSLFQTVSI